MPNVSELRAEADEIVSKTPPGDVALAVFCGLFTVLGWIAGRIWYVIAHTVVLCVVAAKYGYWNGAKVPKEQRVKKAPPQGARTS